MRTLQLIGIFSLFVATSMGAADDRKPLREVSIDALTVELQKSAEPTEGLNLVWVIPIEFWQATFAQDPTIDADDAGPIIDALEEYIIVGVVRADISDFGAFRYHGERDVARALSVTYEPGENDPIRLNRPARVNEDVALLMDMMKPVLEQAMGALGESFHFFMYEAHDAEGRRIASPYQPGRLIVRLAPFSEEHGGTVHFDMPLDSLHEPRQCVQCGQDAHISWEFCPWCGVRLTQ